MSDERHGVAQAVARRAGALALDYWRNRERLTVELKGPQDFVSHADRDVETLIRRELAAAFPADRFLGEETAADFSGPIDRCWVVDPIDGTHNFLRGIAYWNVAIAYVEAGRARIGVVYDPVHDELYRAERGGGAWRDDANGASPLRVAATRELAGAYIALGHHDRAPDARYLHPGPINEGVEVTREVCRGLRSLVLEQARNGVPVRMAVLSMLAESALESRSAQARQEGELVRSRS